MPPPIPPTTDTERWVPLSARKRSHALHEVTVPQLLLELRDGRESGTLVLQAPALGAGGAMHAAIRIDRGQPVAARADGLQAPTLAALLSLWCGVDAGTYELVEDADLVGLGGLRASEPLHLRRVVHAGLRAAPRCAAVRNALREIGSEPLRLRAPVGAFAAQPGPDGALRAVLATLGQGPCGVQALGERTRLPLGALHAAVATLWLDRAVAPYPAGRRLRAVSSPKPPPLPPRRRDEATVQITRPDLAQHAQLQPAGPDPDRWDFIERLTHRGDWGGALFAARDAVRRGPVGAAQQALLGWIMYQHAGGGEVAPRNAMRLLDSALRRDPCCEQALYYKGLILKRTGHPDAALSLLQRLLLTSPEHMAAQREVRLLRMRRAHAHNSLVQRILSVVPGRKHA
ncbi:MAG: hypothetical protein PVI30_15345 [Myxococcales bacterium]|jgi:cytochrome c-type biogenesis protein CcmH/NrfG